MRKYKRSIITGDRAEIIDLIYEQLNKQKFNDISKVVLFGSVSRNEYTDIFDFDLAVISDILTEARFMRSKEFKKLRVLYMM